MRIKYAHKDPVQKWESDYEAEVWGRSKISPSGGDQTRSTDAAVVQSARKEAHEARVARR